MAFFVLRISRDEKRRRFAFEDDEAQVSSKSTSLADLLEDAFSRRCFSLPRKAVDAGWLRFRPSDSLVVERWLRPPSTGKKWYMFWTSADVSETRVVCNTSRS